MDSYWNGKGKYQKEFQRLFDKLVPVADNCDTLAGELIRSANRLCYDFHNNGFCNNTSGAINFLKAHGAIDAHTYEVVHPFTYGEELYEGRYQGDIVHLAVEAIMNQTIEYILENPELETQFNDEDLFDYNDEYFQLDDEDENDDFGW